MLLFLIIIHYVIINLLKKIFALYVRIFKLDRILFSDSNWDTDMVFSKCAFVCELIIQHEFHQKISKRRKNGNKCNLGGVHSPRTIAQCARVPPHWYTVLRCPPPRGLRIRGPSCIGLKLQCYAPCIFMKANLKRSWILTTCRGTATALKHHESCRGSHQGTNVYFRWH